MTKANKPAATPAAPAAATDPVQNTQATADQAAGAAAGDQGGDDGDEGDDDEQIQDPPPAPPARQASGPRPAAGRPAAAPVPSLDEQLGHLVKEGNGQADRVAISLLLEACEKYGINPSKQAKPIELLSWRFLAGSDEQPDAVVLVTAGGMKIIHHDDPAWPMDLDTVDRLRRAYSLLRVDPKTKELLILPFPQDMALPRVAVTGIPTAPSEHRYEGGYLKAGGKSAAEQKEARRQERAKRLGLA